MKAKIVILKLDQIEWIRQRAFDLKISQSELVRGLINKERETEENAN